MFNYTFVLLQNDVVSIGAEDQLAQRLVHGEECRKLIQQSEEDEETSNYNSQ